MICAGGVIEEAGGVLTGESLGGGLFEEILFFHLFYNFYGNGHTKFKTLSIPRQTHIPDSFVPYYSYNLSQNLKEKCWIIRK